MWPATTSAERTRSSASAPIRGNPCHAPSPSWGEGCAQKHHRPRAAQSFLSLSPGTIMAPASSSSTTPAGRIGHCEPNPFGHLCFSVKGTYRRSISDDCTALLFVLRPVTDSLADGQGPRELNSANVPVATRWPIHVDRVSRSNGDQG